MHYLEKKTLISDGLNLQNDRFLIKCSVPHPDIAGSLDLKHEMQSCWPAPDAAPDLERFVELQIQPGSNSPEQAASDRWLPVLKRIQAAGKGLHINAKNAEEFDILTRELRPPGVFIYCGFLNDLNEARNFFTARNMQWVCE